MIKKGDYVEDRVHPGMVGVAVARIQRVHEAPRIEVEFGAGENMILRELPERRLRAVPAPCVLGEPVQGVVEQIDAPDTQAGPEAPISPDSEPVDGQPDW